MATLNVKNLPDALYRKLQARAKRERRSVAQEVTQILSQAVETPRSTSLLELRGLGKDDWRGVDASAHVTLDDDTVATLRRSVERLGKPQSAIVREAIADHGARIGKLSEAERRARLKTFDELVPRIPLRPGRTVDAELGAIRRARRTGGRRHGG